MADSVRSAVLRRALAACIMGDAGVLPELFTQDVSGWSPNMLVTSLAELTDVVADRVDALTDVNVQIDCLDIVGNKGFVEYRLTGVFSGPLVLDDDLVIDPNGNLIALGAAMVAEFTGSKISAFRNYFDDATLLEQLLVA